MPKKTQPISMRLSAEQASSSELPHRPCAMRSPRSRAAQPSRSAAAPLVEERRQGQGAQRPVKAATHRCRRLGGGLWRKMGAAPHLSTPAQEPAPGPISAASAFVRTGHRSAAPAGDERAAGTGQSCALFSEWDWTRKSNHVLRQLESTAVAAAHGQKGKKKILFPIGSTP